MSIPSRSVTSNAIRENTLPCRLGATLRQASFAALKPRLRQRANPPHPSAAAPTQNHESTFSRIHPMNPEPPTVPAQNRNSAFPRIHPMNPEPVAAPAQNRNFAFPRIYPMNPEPPPTPAQNHESAFSRIHPMNPEPPASPAPTPKFAFSRTNPSRSSPSPKRPARAAPAFLRHVATGARLPGNTRGRPIAP